MDRTLLTPFITGLSETQLSQLEQYLALLMKWNARTNLTAVRGESEIVARHFGESLFAAHNLLAPGARLTIADVGSGAGFPGLPIAIYAAQSSVTLIESQNKKATFLREVARALKLSNAQVAAARAEDVTERFELVTMRAVEKFESSAPAAAQLVDNGGRLALLISAAQVAPAHKLLPQFEWREPIAAPQSNARVLLVGTKN